MGYSHHAGVQAEKKMMARWGAGGGENVRLDEEGGKYFFLIGQVFCADRL